ncbi:aldehyde dehydrogenase (NADP(+)) [Paenarthrobacter ureafaciens]|uniref:aldehyde dehydrogenase (NADP(+)) n=1 Tax=Paenarthrobacter ureafaciens TaxID=37931 RepID=UPI0008A6858E|nr:aldehyde dehydrogenase (NADP(+)) [Paenarthrobacter ureafaciens]AOY69978.1 aldehyde dehydrogenase [Arthrobacter sp. ZXY-2]GLU59453.1 aldehyde dehydrogenase [Paenarthrobacter ureafaciens]GLU63811.1 aldehyde dehydrogenase [Paenarthrobacter ureafaciens]GLU67996.1 aldehyde dehydrogenase [Paenarthrobacter ureafaciens]GLU72347.1 aldehyde dehydrogenase [Paenarthrobacter ureafaciens]
MSTATLDLTAVTQAAAAAFKVTAAASDAERATWLTAVADALDANVNELVAIADSETSLGTVRLAGEVARTSGQLRLFAKVITEGSYLEAVIDHADPGATPPKPDLRRILRPVGPVAVFSASNFPFAFSVAGGDTASALAVGCPVIVKAHSGHLRLSERTAEIVSEALVGAGAPEGIFALVSGREAGTALVQDPAIKAVGFTGSIPGGRALFDLAVSRPDPIPFYGELGSLNPVVITEAAVAERGEELAAGLGSSFTMGAGQFCTKPGLVFIPAGTDFAAHLAEASKDKPAAAMLTERIAEAFPHGLRGVAELPGVTLVSGTAEQDALADGAAPVVFATTAANVVERPEELLEECFGPTTLLIEYANQDELSQALAKVPGSLTATVHSQPGEDISALVEQLSELAGRVLFAGWPTGVAVNWAQQHGGPYPATTSLFTSVGATAVRRFQRPVAYQDAPESILHPALHESNPLGIPRRVDGVLQLG